MSYNLSQDVFLYYQFGLCQIFWSQFQLLTNGNLTCLNLLVEKLSTILLSANFETSNKRQYLCGSFYETFLSFFYLFLSFYKTGIYAAFVRWTLSVTLSFAPLGALQSNGALRPQDTVVFPSFQGNGEISGRWKKGNTDTNGIRPFLYIFIYDMVSV